MAAIKISVITVTYNAAATISRCIESVISQQYPNLEYIIIDGGSKDNTLAEIDKYRDKISLVVSEPDKGIYDAMNKGIKYATGAVVGIINADDQLADDQVIAAVAEAFTNKETEAVYGDLDYIDQEDKVLRKWRSGSYWHGRFNWGWMPPHPTFYAKKKLFEEYGYYKLNFGTAADYELMSRFIHARQVKVGYVRKVLVKMLQGGVSNQNFGNRLNAWSNDLRAMRNNGIVIPIMAIVLKPLRKLTQFI